MIVSSNRSTLDWSGAPPSAAASLDCHVAAVRAMSASVVCTSARDVAAAIGRGDTDAAATSLALVQTTLADMARTAATWQSRLAAALGGAPDQSKVERLLAVSYTHLTLP